MSLSTDDRIHDFLIAHRADQFAFLTALVRVPSANPPGDSQAIRARVADLIAQHGYEVSAHAVPPDVLEGTAFSELENLVVRRSFGDGPTIAFAAHLDTAPVGEGWSHDPLGAHVVDGRMYGRGASDGKGHLAAYLFALLSLEPIADELAGTVELHLTFDAYSGGRFGARWLLETETVKPDLAVVPGVARSIGTASTGVLNLVVELQGRTAPAGQPGAGADALRCAAPVLEALYAHADTLKDRRSDTPGIAAPTLVVTEMSGGAGPLTVPDRVRLSLDRRILPEEDPGKVEGEITNIIGRSAGQVPGVICKVRRQRLLAGLQSGELATAFIACLAGHVAGITGEAPVEFGVSRETAARDYAAHGVPVLLYGAGPDYAATPGTGTADESLALDDLRVATEVLARTLADWLHQSHIPASPAPAAAEPAVSEDAAADPE